MKVCYLTSGLSHRDGWSRYSLKVVEGMLKQGVEPLVLTPTDSGESELSGVTHHPVLLPLFSGGRLTSLRMLALRSRVQRYAVECELVHCLVEPFALLASLASARKPIVITAHGTYAVDHLARWPLSYIQKWAYRRAESIVCVSRFTECEILRRVKLVNTMVLRNGVDYEALHRNVTGVKSGDGLVILSVGALKPRKGYDISIHAVAEARKSIPDLRYIIIGDLGMAGYVERLRVLVSQLGLENTVHLLGQVSETELRGWYHRCDLFLLTPVQVGGAFEGFGLVYLEAAACGKPAVGSQSGGVPEAVVDGLTGLLVPEGDVKATADAIVRLLSDPDLSGRLGRAGQERTREFSWEAYAQRLERVYKDVLARGSGLKWD